MADSGLAATSALSSDYRELRARLAHGDVQTAFAQTWEACRNPNAELCKPRVVDADTRQARADLIAAVAARGRAVDALHSAYLALQAEAAYDGRADLEGAVADAWKQAGAYAALMRAPPPTVSTVGSIAKVGAGLFAEQRQRGRIIDAHLRLAGAVLALTEALKREREIHEIIAMGIVDEEIAALDALLDARLVSPMDFAKPVIESVGGTPSNGAEALLAQPGPALTSARAAALEAAEGRKAQIAARYALSLRALEELHALHLAAARDAPSTSDRLLTAIAELQAISTAAQPSPAKEVQK